MLTQGAILDVQSGCMFCGVNTWCYAAVDNDMRKE